MGHRNRFANFPLGSPLFNSGQAGGFNNTSTFRSDANYSQTMPDMTSNLSKALNLQESASKMQARLSNLGGNQNPIKEISIEEDTSTIN